MSVPFFGIDRFYKNHSEKFLNIINTVYTKGHLMMGPEIETFEKRVSQFCNRKYGVAVGSCTDALFFALKASGIKANDEVFVTSFSFHASGTAILRAGAIPIFVDIDPNTLMMDLDDLRKKVTSKSKAIIAVHLFGKMMDVDELEKTASQYNLIVIEDAAQTLGSEWNGKKGGSVGTCSCISFDPTKIIGAFGNGGILITDDSEIYDTVSALRNHSNHLASGNFENLGYNSKMSEAQAALIVYQLNLLPKLIAKREKIANLYDENLKGINQVSNLQHYDYAISNFHKYVIKVEQRDALQAHLKEKGIQTKIHYPYIIPELKMFKLSNNEIASFTNAQKAKSEVLSLPIYPELTQNEAMEVCKAIKEFFGN